MIHGAIIAHMDCLGWMDPPGIQRCGNIWSQTFTECNKICTYYRDEDFHALLDGEVGIRDLVCPCAVASCVGNRHVSQALGNHLQH